MKSKFWGLLILVVVVVGAVVYAFLPKGKPEITMAGYLGGEKSGLFKNEKFKDILKKKYNLTIDYKIVGSYDMVQEDSSGQDYLFPSSQLALELFEKLGNSPADDEIVLNTPMVLYSRKAVVEKLLQEKIVNQTDGVYYVDMVKLADLMAQGKKWSDIGLNQLSGRILVSTTNPNASNSGNMFLGLLANVLNGNQVVGPGDVDKVIPTLQQIYQALGFMETSSSDMFNQFLKLGIGKYPIVAGYESQLLEFSKEQPDVFNQVKDDLVIMYPIPTVWSSHVFIALNDNGKAAIQALLDPEIQKLAWKEHGFRTIVAGTGDPKEFNVAGLAKDVTQIMSMPRIDVMLELMAAIK